MNDRLIFSVMKMPGNEIEFTLSWQFHSSMVFHSRHFAIAAKCWCFRQIVGVRVMKSKLMNIFHEYLDRRSRFKSLI